MWESQTFNADPPILGQDCDYKVHPHGEYRAGSIMDRYISSNGYHLIVRDDTTGDLYDLLSSFVRVRVD